MVSLPCHRLKSFHNYGSYFHISFIWFIFQVLIYLIIICRGNKKVMRDLHTVFSMEIAFLSSLTTFSTDRISCGIYTRGTSLMLTYPFLLYLKYIICSKITSDYFFEKHDYYVNYYFFFILYFCYVSLRLQKEQKFCAILGYCCNVVQVRLFCTWQL